MTTSIHVHMVPVVLSCDHCRRFYHPVVQFEDGCEPIVANLPDNCRCGEMLDTPETICWVIDSAIRLRDALRNGALS